MSFRSALEKSEGVESTLSFQWLCRKNSDPSHTWGINEYAHPPSPNHIHARRLEKIQSEYTESRAVGNLGCGRTWEALQTMSMPQLISSIFLIRIQRRNPHVSYGYRERFSTKCALQRRVKSVLDLMKLKVVKGHSHKNVFCMLNEKALTVWNSTTWNSNISKNILVVASYEYKYVAFNASYLLLGEEETIPAPSFLFSLFASF